MSAYEKLIGERVVVVVQGLAQPIHGKLSHVGDMELVLDEVYVVNRQALSVMFPAPEQKKEGEGQTDGV
jgi:hypothetical protein